jgi:glycosyltransferase involved in cell wall biosynthesis
MKIIHVVPSYLPAWRYGGPIRSVHGLCRALARRGHEVTVLTSSIDGPEDLDVPHDTPVKIDGVTVYYYPVDFRRICRAPGLKKKLKAILPSADALHIHSIFLWPSWVAASLARSYGKPYVLAPLGMLDRGLFSKKNRIAKWLWLLLVGRRDIERADAIRVTSRRERERLAEFRFRNDRILELPNGIDPEAVPTGEPSDPIRETAARTPYFLFLGRISWIKGLDRLIRAVARAPEAVLVVAGNDDEGYLPALRAIVEACGVADRVRFCGAVYDADKRHLLSGCLAMILPSYSENFGNVVLESLAAGRPVIATPEVGASDVVADFGAGLVVEGAPEALAAAMTRFLENPGEADRMGRLGKEAVARHYSWDAIAERIERHYAGANPCR